MEFFLTIIFLQEQKEKKSFIDNSLKRILSRIRLFIFLYYLLFFLFLIKVQITSEAASAPMLESIHKS